MEESKLSTYCIHRSFLLKGAFKKERLECVKKYEHVQHVWKLYFLKTDLGAKINFKIWVKL